MPENFCSTFSSAGFATGAAVAALDLGASSTEEEEDEELDEEEL